MMKREILITKDGSPTIEIAEMNVVGKVEGKHCILIDDMIDTAGSITGAADALKEKGAKKVYVCATHAILSDPALERLQRDSIEEVILTDSIYHEKLPDSIQVVPVAPLFGESIKAIQKKLSVSKLFDFSLEKHDKLTDFKGGSNESN